MAAGEMGVRMRFYTIDNIRGINLISMILYHLVWDMVYIFGISLEWYESEAGYLWQQSICWTFIFLSGFCWTLGKQHFKRGCIVSLAGAAISVITILIMPEQRIVFGVLSMLGACMLLMIPLDKAVRKWNKYAGLLMSVVLFFFVREINEGFFGFESMRVGRVPSAFYKGYMMTFLGFPDESFQSTDYFSLFPWFFLFLAGYFAFQIVSEHEKNTFLQGKKMSGISYVGKYSLPIYMLHQPIIYGALFVGTQLSCAF